MTRSRAVKPQKSKLRQRFLERRDQLDLQEATRASAAVCHHLAERKLLSQAGVLAGYMAKGQEINLRTYLAQRLEEGTQVLLPRISGPGTMEFCLLESWEELQPGPFGIAEPIGAPRSIEDVEVFLVPGLAFDFRGHRLGFGKGFYDRALPALGEAVAIGVGHHWQLIDEPLPVEPHDRAMDFVLTDRGWHTPSRDSQDLL